MNSVLIPVVHAHDGEAHVVQSAQPEITYATFGLGAQIATGVILTVIVLVGGFLIMYNKNSQKN